MLQQRFRAIYWWWRGLAPRDVAAIAIVAILAALGLAFLGSAKFDTFNWGFGPGWQCSPDGGGGSVCLKQQQPKAQ